VASVLFVRDANAGRRRRALDAAKAALGELGPLTIDSVEIGPIGAVWGTGPAARIQHRADAARATVLVGDVIAGPGPARLTPRDYDGLSTGGEVPPPCDGYHLAATFDGHGTLTVATDVLGMFPIYYHSAEDAVLAASHLPLLQAHESFRPALDPMGLIGLLLTGGLVDGRTLYRGVKRLAPGHVLRASPGRDPEEVRHYAVPVSTIHHDAPFPECAHRLHDALVRSCRRHVLPETPPTLMLSGGLDSRLLAGLLARQGVTATAFTLGAPSDIEFTCARAVAEELRLPHTLVPEDARPVPLERRIRWEGVTSSLAIEEGDLAAIAARFPSPLLTGYVMDAVVGGSHIDWCYDTELDRCSHERFFARVNAYGLPVEALRRLLRPEWAGDCVQAVRDAVRRSYDAAGDDELSRAWQFDLAHRQRYWVGQVLPTVAFGAWPCLPALDREVLEVAGGVPLGLLAERRLEIEVLKRFYPRLAALPLDRNARDTTPLLPSAGQLLRGAFARRLRRLGDRIGLPRRERRFYYRTHDFNSPRWRQVRRAAEPAREIAYSVFDRRAYDALLPPAEARWSGEDPIVDSAAVKTLLAVTLWLGQELGTSSGSP
jgi:asparagine synthase (glutamine-hydrolysing)